MVGGLRSVYGDRGYDSRRSTRERTRQPGHLEAPQPFGASRIEGRRRTQRFPFHSCASSQGVWKSPRSLREEFADTTDPSCVADCVVVLEPPLTTRRAALVAVSFEPGERGCSGRGLPLLKPPMEAAAPAAVDEPGAGILLLMV